MTDTQPENCGACRFYRSTRCPTGIDNPPAANDPPCDEALAMPGAGKDTKKFKPVDEREFVASFSFDVAAGNLAETIVQQEKIGQWLWDLGSLPGLTKREQEAAFLCLYLKHTAEDASLMMSAVFLPGGKIAWNPIEPETVRQYLRNVKRKAAEFGSEALQELAASHRSEGSEEMEL